MKKNFTAKDISSSKTHLIFDFDETIVKLLLPWDKIFNDIEDELAKFDKKIFEDLKKEKINASDFRNKYVLRFGDKLKKIIINSQKEFEKGYLRGYLKNQLIIDFINKNTKYKMFIWSSNTKSTVEKILKELGVIDKFLTIVSSEDVKFLKPYTDGFMKINQGKIDKGKYLFIGDSKSDKKAAEDLGIDFCIIDYFDTPGKYW